MPERRDVPPLSRQHIFVHRLVRRYQGCGRGRDAAGDPRRSQRGGDLQLHYHTALDRIFHYNRGRPQNILGPGFPEPDRTRARNPLSNSRGLHQQRNRLSAVPQPQNGAKLRLEHIRQVGSVGSLSGNSPRPRGRARDERRLERQTYRNPRLATRRGTTSLHFHPKLRHYGRCPW